MFDFKTGKEHSHGSTIGILLIFPATFLIVPIILSLGDNYPDLVKIIIIPSGFGLFVIFTIGSYKTFLKCPKCQVLGLRKSFFAGGDTN